MHKKNNKFLVLSLLLSIFLNVGFLYLNFKNKSSAVVSQDSSKVIIVKIRDIGRKNATDKRDSVQLKDLTIQSNPDLLTKRSDYEFQKKESQMPTRKNALENLKANKNVVITSEEKSSDFILNTSTQFESKKGVAIDELNTDELVYYAFKMRTAKQYKNAVLQNINDLKSKYPTLFLKLKNSIHQMRGKISYDQEGNVIEIKILKWSDSNEIQDFFVNALKDIRAIPNPPKGILNDDGFKATYDLQLSL